MADDPEQRNVLWQPRRANARWQLMSAFARALAAVIVSQCLATAASAQTSPFVHGATIGTSPVQVLATDPLRRKMFFSNPNASASVAYCPSGPNRDTGLPLVCAINGPGSITLTPGQAIAIDCAVAQGPPLFCPSAWNGVASAPGSAYSIIDFE